jgi:hypothetical protein
MCRRTGSSTGRGGGEESGGDWVELIRQTPMRDESRGVAAHAATLNVSRRVCAAARTRTVAERGCDLERGAGAQRKSWDRGRDVHLSQLSHFRGPLSDTSLESLKSSARYGPTAVVMGRILNVDYWHVRDVTPAAARAAAIKGCSGHTARSPFMLRPRCRTLKALHVVTP